MKRGFLFAALIPCLSVLQAEEAALTGKEIFAKHCADCHGDHGQGVKDKCDDPLLGERSLSSLTRYIDRNMPEDDEDLVVGEDAQKVAEYISRAFYSPEARVNYPKPAVAFSRLTNRQFRESVADLIGSFGQRSEPSEGTGLKARYFQSDGMNKNARQAFERVDTAIDFDFGEASPGQGITAEQFGIVWEGSLLPPVTGWYEFRLSTPNGARVTLNEVPQDGREDSGSKRREAFIDEWVSSGNETRVKQSKMFLLAGRPYLLRVDYFKYKEATAKVKLEWKMPQDQWQVLRSPYLSPAWVRHVAVISTDFPADDASEGYERGTSISREWHEATTRAAIEAANLVVESMHRLSGIKEKDPDRLNKFKEFIAQFASRAFRQPLTEELRKIYVESPFSEGIPVDQSVKRAVLLIIKSPRFLYPEVLPRKDDFAIATRLALGMWDSIPDQALLDAAKAGQLHDPQILRQQAQRMSKDSRAKAKLNEFFQLWLKLDGEGGLTKKEQDFPGFDASLVSDLKFSLEKFVSEVLWSEQSDYRQLMLADYLWMNERMAAFYHMELPPGEGYQQVKQDPTQRSGVITHPYMLAKLAHVDTTSPIHRGVFLTRNVLGGMLKPPPEAIAFENLRFDPKMTMREKITEMTRNSKCMTCHETINPLGFALENFDSAGRYRTEEHGRKIDSSAEYNTLEGDLLPLRSARDVAQLAVSSASARRGFIRHMFQFVVKQNPAVYSSDQLQKLDQFFVSHDYHMRDLFIEINASTAIQQLNTQEP